MADTAKTQWMDDVTVEVTVEDVMADLDPAILLWQQVFAPAR